MPSEAPHEDNRRGIDRLEDSLYSRQHARAEEGNPVYKTKMEDVRDTWDDMVAKDTPPPASLVETAPLPPEGKKISTMKIIFIFSILFFVCAAGLAGYIFYHGDNVVSSGNVDITMESPVSVKGGEELDFTVGVTNRNNINLDKATLTITYPEGTKDADDLTKDLIRSHEELGRMNAGGYVQKNIRAVLFGEEGSEKTIEVGLEYRVANSNALFEKKITKTVVVSSSPVTMTVKAFKEVNAGQEMEFTVDISSNSTSVIQKLLLKAEYPFGFQFTSGNPSPAEGGTLWHLGDLAPAAKRTVTLRGRVSGQDGEVRTVKFAVGTENPKDNRLIGTVFLNSVNTITIKKPFLSANLTLDGDTASADYITRAGKTIRADIVFTNNLATQVTNAAIEVHLNGTILDKNSVIADQGFYQSANNTITWDKERKSDLAVLNPGDSGTVSFTFAPTNLTGANSATHNPEIAIEISVKGTRLSETNVPESITAGASRKVKIATDLGLSPRILYSVGPFANTGGVPPHAEKQTTYTVTWTVSNTVNTVANGQVTAKLPSYVRFLNKVSPSNERVVYEAVGGKVTWDIGEIKAGVGYGAPAREVSFQVGFTPSASQIGSAPTLVNDILVSGIDRFTGTTLSSTKSALTTRITTDPIYANGVETVGQ